MLKFRTPEPHHEDIPNKIKSGLGIAADVDLRREESKPFIAITVKPYSFPVSYHGKYHYRSGATKQELTGTALDEFMLRKLGKTWDGAPNPLVKFKDLDQASFDAFREKALSSGRLSKDDLNLTDFELLKSLRLQKVIEDRERIVLDFVTAHGGIKNKDAQNLLRLSDPTVKKLFEKIAADNKLKAIGERGQRVYVLPSDPA